MEVKYQPGESVYAMTAYGITSVTIEKVEIKTTKKESFDEVEIYYIIQTSKHDWLRNKIFYEHQLGKTIDELFKNLREEYESRKTT